MEERPEEPRKRNSFSVITDSLNDIWECCARTRKVVRVACTMVGAEGEDSLLETLSEMSQKQAVIDLQVKNGKLEEEKKWLKEELEDEKKANTTAATKLNESLDLIRKMEEVVQQPTEIFNKARFFDEGLAKNPVTIAKVIPVLVDFNQKIDEILLDMRALFNGLEVEGLVPLDQVPNISINMEELLTLQNQEVVEASLSTCSTPQFLRKSPMKKLRLTPRKEVGFSLELSHRTSLVQIGFEGTRSKPILVKDQPEEVGVDPKSGSGQEDRVTPFPVGVKTRPMTRSRTLLPCERGADSDEKPIIVKKI